MSQRELNRLVARATGESRGTIHQRGFTLADPLEVSFDPEPDCLKCDRRNPLDQYLDWDQVQANRQQSLANC